MDCAGIVSGADRIKDDYPTPACDLRDETEALGSAIQELYLISPCGGPRGGHLLKQPEPYSVVGQKQVAKAKHQHGPPRGRSFN